MAARKSYTSKEKKRDYSTTASKKVGKAIHEMKRGQLRSGKSRQLVTSRKQAIAIGLSEARQKGAKMPTSAKSNRRSRPTSEAMSAA